MLVNWRFFSKESQRERESESENIVLESVGGEKQKVAIKREGERESLS